MEMIILAALCLCVIAFQFYVIIKQKKKLTFYLESIKNLKDKNLSFEIENKKKQNTNHHINTQKIVNSIKVAVDKSGDIIENSTSNMIIFNQEVERNNSATQEVISIINKVQNSIQDLVRPLESINKCSENFQVIEKNLSDLYKTVEEVNSKSSNIIDISLAAKLLSFNASVEAARAGEAGKGFSVVAEEVGKLAKNTETTSKEIQGLVFETSSFLNDVSKTISAQLGELQEVVASTNDTFNSSKNSINGLQKVVNELTGITQDFKTKLEHFGGQNTTGLESLSKLLSDCIGTVLGIEVEDLTVHEVQQRLDEFEIIDVRRPDEFHGELGHIKGAKLFTLQDNLDSKLKSLDKEKKYLFVCRSGGRSAKAARIALNNQFQHVYNMEGGMLAWHESKLPLAS